MKPLCSLNGRILPLTEARIDPQDRGFLFGDSLYEGIKVLDGTILHLDLHLDRLRSGLGRVDIPSPDDLELRCHELVEACGPDTGFLYLQVTRGVGPRSHVPPRDLAPTILILPSAPVYDPPAGRPRSAVTAPDWRWQHCDLKTNSLMATVQGKLRMRDLNADEVLFVGPAGQLREGGNTTLFVRRDDLLETHPLDGHILPGITRRILLRLADELRLPVVERAPLLTDRESWQEAFLCGTLTGVQPLTVLDDDKVADGAVGEWTRDLARDHAALEEDLTRRGVPR